MVLGFRFGKLGKVVLVFGFCGEEMVVDNWVVDGDGVFGVVGGWGKFGGIVDGGFVGGMDVVGE